MKRIRNLDICRAIAVLLVIFSHLGQSWNRNGLIDQDDILFRLTSIGAHGVELFFVISGYLISLIYSKENFQVSVFLWRRIARIAPLWFFYLLVWVLIHRVLNSGQHLESITTWILLVLMASSLTPDASNSFLQGNFSISNEWLFYLTFPILRKFRTQSLFIVGAVCTIFAITLKVNVGFYADISNQLTEREKWIGIFSVWNAFPFFISGILLQRYLSHRSQFKPSTLKLFGASIITYCAMVLYLSIDSYRDVYAPLILLVFIFVLNIVIKSRLLSWLGQRSYGIFFAHFLLIGGYERAIAALGLSFNPIIALIQIFFVTLGSSFIANLTWRYIEKPISISVRRKYG